MFILKKPSWIQSHWSVLVGYSRTQKGYRFFSPDLGQYLDFANVSFVEDRSFFVEYESSLYLYESDDLFLNHTLLSTLLLRLILIQVSSFLNKHILAILNRCHLKLKPHVKLHQRILNLYQYLFQHLQILLHTLISLLHFIKVNTPVHILILFPHMCLLLICHPPQSPLLLSRFCFYP